MCGLVGYADTRLRRRPELRTLEQMAAVLRHRGPDSAGFAVVDHVGLGVRRLAIVDPPGGDQPLWNEDRSVVVGCNGEILNHEDLRRQLLDLGHRFTSGSDVEVVVHLYEEVGIGLVDHLDGQFGLAVYDRRRRRLLLARDPAGIVPLHYSVVDGVLVFGSEVKSLLVHPLVPREVDPRGLDQVLTLPGLVSPQTMFRSVASLPPGHRLVVDGGGPVRVEQYWDLDYPHLDEASPPGAGDHREHLDRLEASLRRAVTRRRQGDGPVGLYLSGGLDSSLLAALAAQTWPDGRLDSFSIAFTDPGRSEQRYQQLVAATLGTRHTEVVLGPADLRDGLAAAVWHGETPVKESYNVASMRLSAMVRAGGTKAVITGEGADELFAGYVGYKFDRMRADRRVPGVPLTEDEQLCAVAWGNPDLAYGRRFALLARLRQELFSPAVARQLGPLVDPERPLVDPSRLQGRHLLHQRSYLDFKLRLPDHLLGDHGDRMAMAHSVEVRYPFLDREVIECARVMPPELKLHDFEEKYPLRQIGARHLPAEVVAREKFAFSADPSPQLLHAGAAWLDDLLSASRIRREGYFMPAAVEALRARYSREEFTLDLLYEDDLLLLVATFGLLLEAFDLPALS